MGQTAAVSFGAPFGRSIRVRFRFRCSNAQETAPTRALGPRSNMPPSIPLSYGHGNFLILHQLVLSNRKDGPLPATAIQLPTGQMQ